MATRSAVEATVTCMSERASCSAVGLMTYSPSTRPTTTPEIGPSHGISEMEIEMEAPIMAVISGEQSGSTDMIRCQTMETSLRISFGNRGRMGAVDDAGGQDRLFGRAAFPALEGAGDAADRVEFFLIVDGKGEEVHAVAGLGRHGDVAEHDGVTVADQAEPPRAAPFCRFPPSGAVRQGGFEYLEFVEHSGTSDVFIFPSGP